jgi:hypothetical protein
MRLFHYTDEIGLQGILNTETLHPSTFARNPNDVRYGDGQYFSDIPPRHRTPSQLSPTFLNIPFLGRKFTRFIEIDATGLNVIQGRNGVFVLRNDRPLDLSGRIVSWGQVPLA